jgi:hypothetical protein
MVNAVVAVAFSKFSWKKGANSSHLLFKPWICCSCEGFSMFFQKLFFVVLRPIIRFPSLVGSHLKKSSTSSLVDDDANKNKTSICLTHSEANFLLNFNPFAGNI